MPNNTNTTTTKELNNSRDLTIVQALREALREEMNRDENIFVMGEDIHIEYAALDDALLTFGKLSQEGFYIEVDESLRNASVDVLKGGIAHECAHIVFEKLKVNKALSIDMFAYRVSSRYRILDERNTDLEVILRGFGNELLLFLQHSVRLRLDHYREDGLSLREIEILIAKTH